MSKKHTPGPWRHIAVEGGWDGVAETCQPSSIICKLSLNNPANARLIAAAPEMYELLLDVLCVVRKGPLPARIEKVLGKVEDA